MRLIISGNLPGKRARGRSPTRWTEYVQQNTGYNTHSVKLFEDKMETDEEITIISYDGPTGERVELELLCYNRVQVAKYTFAFSY